MISNKVFIPHNNSLKYIFIKPHLWGLAMALLLRFENIWKLNGGSFTFYWGSTIDSSRTWGPLKAGALRHTGVSSASSSSFLLLLLVIIIIIIAIIIIIPPCLRAGSLKFRLGLFFDVCRCTYVFFVQRIFHICFCDALSHLCFVIF